MIELAGEWDGVWVPFVLPYLKEVVIPHSSRDSALGETLKKSTSRWSFQPCSEMTTLLKLHRGRYAIAVR